MSTRLSPFLGLLLLAVVFAYAGFQQIRPAVDRFTGTGDPERIILRFAHRQLEGGIREAFEAVCAEYQALHPHVVLDQIAVPERAWNTWMRTQLVGGTPPDLIQMPENDELQARFLRPLTEWIDLPNPYNEGTALAGIAWRETFLDGLTNPPAFNPNLLEFYGIPVATSTIRLAYNAELLREITGSAQLPESYSEFLELCRATVEFAATHRRTLIPIAGSGHNTWALVIRLFGTQTQRLGLEVDPFYTLNVTTRETAPAFLRGVWSLDSPEVRDGLAIWEELAPFIQPGFLQLAREDAQFYFSQGRALFIGVTSRDINSVVDESAFTVGIFDIPQPDDHPRFGRNVLGRNAEADKPLSTAFGLTRASRHPEVAVDFLRFLSSHRGATRFARVSNWMSATVGVAPNPGVAGFLPVPEGVTNGFGIHFTGYGASRTRHLFNAHQHLIYSGRNGSEAFVAALQPEFGAMLREDIAHLRRTTVNNVRRIDSAHAAHRRLATVNERATARLSLLLEAQNRLEAEAAILQHTLTRHR
jgi:raffinose/stachyose/melibiose transport system substrate-binding protein